MGEDKHKVNRQRNIHLSGDCGNAADMRRDFLYVDSIILICEIPERKRQRLVKSRITEGNG